MVVEAAQGDGEGMLLLPGHDMDGGGMGRLSKKRPRGCSEHELGRPGEVPPDIGGLRSQCKGKQSRKRSAGGVRSAAGAPAAVTEDTCVKLDAKEDGGGAAAPDEEEWGGKIRSRGRGGKGDVSAIMVEDGGGIVDKRAKGKGKQARVGTLPPKGSTSSGAKSGPTTEMEDELRNQV